MDIRELDIDNEAEVDAWIAIDQAAHQADEPDLAPPSAWGSRSWMRNPWPGDRDEKWTATVDGGIVATAAISYPTLENLQNAFVGVGVHPAYRRRGIGRGLFEFCHDRIKAEPGRTNLITSVTESVDGGAVERPGHGAAFARAMGFEKALVEMRRRLDFSTVDDDAMDALLAESWKRAEDYETIRWVNHAPPEIIDDLAYLDGRMSTDVPLGDLKWEPEDVDAERVRKYEDFADAARRTRVHMGLRHRETGRLVAWSFIVFNLEQREHAFQAVTIVDPEHRGHRLGTVVKLELHKYVRAVEPALRTVVTTNADVNSFMININEAIGYRIHDSRVDYQRTA